MLSDIPSNLSTNDINEITTSAHGFVGSDLAALCCRAALHATQQNNAVVNVEDLKFALTRIGPSAMRDFQIEVNLTMLYVILNYSFGVLEVLIPFVDT